MSEKAKASGGLHVGASKAAALTADIQSHNFSHTELANRYRVSTEAISLLQRQIASETPAALTEAFIVVLFVWAVIDGDYVEASVIALRWIALAWRLLKPQPAVSEGCWWAEMSPSQIVEEMTRRKAWKPLGDRGNP